MGSSLSNCHLVFGSLSQTCRRRSGPPGSSPCGFTIYPIIGLSCSGRCDRSRALFRALSHPAWHDRACRHRGCRMVDCPRHRRLSASLMLVFGIGAMAAGFAASSMRRSCSITPMSATPSCSVLCRRRHRRRRLVSRRHPRRAHRRRNSQPHLDGQSPLSQVMLFAVMTLVLVVSPRGLLGSQGRE